MANDIVTYEINGDEIKLSPSIVQQFVTKGNGEISQVEAVNFMQLCRFTKLNPFLNEVYLIKFGDSPAQMITAKEALAKRASRQPDYEGITSGLVTVDKNGNVNRREGQILYPGEQLLGAWAKVIREKFAYPIYVEVAFSEYDTGKFNWKKMPANMIDKVAQAKALRQAYPDELGGMYIEEEPSIDELKDVTADKNGDPVTFEHTTEYTEPTDTIEDKIKSLKKYIKENHSDFKTIKSIEEHIGNKLGVDYKDLKELKILSELLLIEKEIIPNEG